MADLYYLLGAILGFFGLTYLIRWSFLGHFKSWKGMGYAATILTIVGPVSSGIGGADGGPFNIESMKTQFGVSVVLMLIVWFWTYSKREEYEYVSNGWVVGSIIWILSLAIFGGIGFLTYIVMQNNPNLF